MRCRICGTENEEGRVICSRCLKPLALSKKSRKGRKKEYGKLLAMIAAATILIAGIILLIVLTRPKQNTETTGTDESAQVSGETKNKQNDSRDEEEDPNAAYFAEDAETYYAEHGDLIRSTEALESENVRTEAETVSGMKERGLEQYPVTSEYAMDGKYTGEADISGAAKTKHPMYSTYYRAENGDLWTISEINGQVTAFPVTYNLYSGNEIQVLVAESEVITSYDSETNRYFETVPDPMVLRVITVEKIDAETLERLSREGVDSQ